MAKHLPIAYYHLAKETRIRCTTEAAKSWPRTIKCSRGCSACCHRKITISIAEAIEIILYLKKENLWDTVAPRISKLDMDMSLLDPVVYFSIYKPCVLLKNNECLAYPVRPLNCASHYVHSDPELCDPMSPASGNYEMSDVLIQYFEFRSKLDKLFDNSSVLKWHGWLPFALKAASLIVEHKYESFEDFISVYKGDYS